eukprot:854688-Prymnesium_polylepis.1
MLSALSDDALATIAEHRRRGCVTSSRSRGLAGGTRPCCGAPSPSHATGPRPLRSGSGSATWRKM